MHSSITVKIPNELLQMIDELVERGEFKTRGEVVRAAIEEFVYKRVLFPGLKPSETVKGALTGV